MPENADHPPAEFRRTPLYGAHLDCGARVVPFAGYEMPVQYPSGILEEHAWTRRSAGLFDISHMGQAVLRAGDGRHETVAAALEALVPADIVGLKPGQQRYTQLLNASGGVIDDLMVTRPRSEGDEGTLLLVLNASRKDIDCAHIAAHVASGVTLEPEPDLALLALQGPKAAGVLSELCSDAARLAFMHAARLRLGSWDCHVSRSGYTGEDGFEISLPAGDARPLWDALLAVEDVRTVGLGARDSLRLEAGLCLYGHELDETTSPVEARLAWSIQKRRRESGGFPGADRIMREIAEGPSRLRVGIIVEGRAPARDGAQILSEVGRNIGIVTSGGYAPTLKQPVALGYVEPAHAARDTPVKLLVRGKPLDAHVAELPFVPHAYARNASPPSKT